MSNIWVEIHSPFLLGIIMIAHLIRQPKYAIVYVVCSVINNQFNRVLKRIYKEPRPQESSYDKTHDDTYGMPSGHAQHIVFTLVFLVLVRPSWIVFWICLTVGVIGVMERYLHRRHTINQLLVGGMVGGVFAVVSVATFRFFGTRDFWERRSLVRK